MCYLEIKKIQSKLNIDLCFYINWYTCISKSEEYLYVSQQIELFIRPFYALGRPSVLLLPVPCPLSIF